MTELAFIEGFLAENAPYAREKHASRSNLTVATKRDANDLLTEVDLTLQKRAAEQIQSRFPNDVLVAEEGAHARIPADPNVRCWVMDPIDGTNNFVRGLFPIYGISMAFANAGEVVAAGVAFPGIDQTFLAERGSGAFVNRSRMAVSGTKLLEEARLDVDFSRIANRNEVLDRARMLVAEAGQIRAHGSAVASICQVASADLDGFVHVGLSPWDYAASQLLVEEAGGMATRLDGSPLRLFDGRRGVMVSNGALHRLLLERISS